MYKSIIISVCSIALMTLLSGCVIPVSSGCSTDQHFEDPNSPYTAKGQNCSTADAAVYLASALLKEAQKTPDKEAATHNPPAKNANCSHLVGKSQKECIRLEKDAYDPLDEL
ncbi:hypothetical protein [Colwellia piezophila]|uniref:hypothetical protein n=1 Tax=Colwellia piezophila TaxID=211668 RepID=UPI0003613C24|nr:hypothetical protein [Colwellia piezophila]